MTRDIEPTLEPLDEIDELVLAESATCTPGSTRSPQSSPTT